MCRLTRSYFYFCLSEIVFLNLVGLVTLLFQKDLANWIHPGRKATFDEENMYQFWFQDHKYDDDHAMKENDISVSMLMTSEKESCLIRMVSECFVLFNIFMALINFDTHVPKSVKRKALLIKCLCDIHSFVLLYQYSRKIIHRNHIYGTVLVDVLRIMFVILGDKYCFVEDEQSVEAVNTNSNSMKAE